MNGEAEVVRATAAAWDAWWADGLSREVRDDCCILAARCAVHVFKSFGVTAWGVSTTTLVANRAAVDLGAAGVPFEQWPAWAWSIGCGPPEYGVDRRNGNGGYEAHVWACTPQHWVDLSARQFARPGRIIAEGALVVPADHVAHVSPTCWAWWDAHDQLWDVTELVHDRGYRSAPNWASNWRPYGDELSARTRALLATSS